MKQHNIHSKDRLAHLTEALKKADTGKADLERMTKAVTEALSRTGIREKEDGQEPDILLPAAERYPYTGKTEQTGTARADILFRHYLRTAAAAILIIPAIPIAATTLTGNPDKNQAASANRELIRRDIPATDENITAKEIFREVHRKMEKINARIENR